MSRTAQRTPVYTERPGNMWWMRGALIAWLLFVAWGIIDTGGEVFTNGSWVVFPLFLPFVGLFSLITLSKRRYHSITLDPWALRVGKHRLAVADIDPHSVHLALAEVDPTFAQRLATALNVVQFPGSNPAAAGEPDLMGGAWGMPMGMDSVVLADRAGRTFRVATRDRRGFLAALAPVVHQF